MGSVDLELFWTELIKAPEILDSPHKERIMQLANRTQIRVGFACISDH